MRKPRAISTGTGAIATERPAPVTAAMPIRKHSLTIRGHRTSVSLEPVFWQALDEIAAARGLSRTALVAEIDAAQIGGNLSSAIRVFVLQHFRAAPERD